MNQWYKQPSTIPPHDYCLQKAFKIALGNETSPPTYLFDEIYVPIPKINKDYYTYTEQEDPDNPGETIIVENVPEELQGLDPHAYHEPFEYKYVNVGMDIVEITDYYWTLFGYNMLSVPIIDRDLDFTNESTLGKKMNVIVKANQYKYLKWIQSMGYAYNPLWNVDGTDWFQYIDTHGNVVRKDSPILQYADKLKTNAYEGTLRDTNETQNTYAGTYLSGTTETFGKSSYDDTQNIYSVSKEEHDAVTNESIDGPVKSITGGDYSHIEKRIRQGNIGVTQTSELIKNERDLVRFNIIDEFFKDINKQLLVGIYPGF